MTSHISPEMHAAVGRVVRERTSYPVTASDVRRWALAARWPEPAPARYLTEDTTELVAPADLNPFAWISLRDTLADADLDIGDSGWIEKQLGLECPQVSHQLNGGVEDEYDSSIRVGDTISSRTVLAGYHEREGRLGRMLFTTLADTWTNQQGERVKLATMILIRH